MKTRQPVLFVSHGSPMTAVDGSELGIAWTELGRELQRPDAILMVSAHWTTNQPMVGGATHPATIHDFGGFPQALYALRYPASGAPELAKFVRETLLHAGITTGLDVDRGLDHGAWVPLRFLFPQANVPIVP